MHAKKLDDNLYELKCTRKELLIVTACLQLKYNDKQFVSTENWHKAVNGMIKAVTKALYPE